MKFALVVWFTFVILLATLFAQEKPVIAPTKDPVLTIEQQKDLKLAFQEIELWQLRATNAIAEFEKAKVAVQQLVSSITPPGYQINQNQGKYELVKLPEISKDKK